jgi:hypothetical protein
MSDDFEIGDASRRAAHAVDERHQAAPKDGNGDPVGIGSGD